MLGRIASLHYTHGLTHEKIANLLGLSRVQVTRMLAKAREEGIVEIKVHSDESIFPDLQIALGQKYGLRQVWIAPSFDNPEQSMESVGALGSEFLRSYLKPGDVVAVGLSVTLDHIVPHLRGFEIDATFIPALGSRPSGNPTVNPHEVASDLAEIVGGKTRHLPAPFIMASIESANMMKEEPDVKTTLDMAKAARLGLYGIGGVAPGSGPLIEEIGPTGELERLIKAGAVGDISGIYFDANGEYVPSSIEQRIISLTLDEIYALPDRAIVAMGKNKAPAISAAARSGMITHLITDLDTAEELLRIS
ncbi:MAG: sugar-binding transcriptional regulator [Aquiluna sp.]|jgi:lsr operon transcriptional repressor|nr:sugar-binding transcriptional regulator [Aquiluna sp.]